MPVDNAHWYNLNENRLYPLADTATGIDANGDRLPSNIIVDLNLRYPSSYGAHAFVSAVFVSDNIVSLTIQGSASSSSVAGFEPIAAISLKQPIVEGRHYALDPQQDGVAGWVVFGSGVKERYSGRFAGPQASLIVASASRTYDDLPVTGFGKTGLANLLTGVVELEAEEPLQITTENRTIDGESKTVAVFSLIENDVGEQSVFEQFAGPCGRRPESGNCVNPPLERLNTVGPDCDGNVTVELTGCAKLAEVLVIGGVVIDCGLGLSDACGDNGLADSDGLLPNEYDDECESYIVESESLSEVVYGSESENTTAAISLPLTEDFESAVTGWTTIDGGFNRDTETGSANYVWKSTSVAELNLATVDVLPDPTADRVWSGDIQLKIGSYSGKRNGGLICNYRDHDSDPTKKIYYIAEIDYDDMELRVKRFNGSTTSLLASTAVSWIALDEWFTLTVTITQAGGGRVNIHAYLESVDTPALTASLGPFTDANFFPDTGVPGVYANKSETWFDNLSWDEV